jgi:hypothetical protein
MTADDQRKAKAEALLQFEEAKARFALLKNEAHAIAEDLLGMSNILMERPETVVFTNKDVELMKGYKNLGTLVDDLKKTQLELQRLSGVLTDAGLSHVLNGKN